MNKILVLGNVISLKLCYLSGILDQAYIRRASQTRTETVIQMGHYFTDHDSICIILSNRFIPILPCL